MFVKSCSVNFTVEHLEDETGIGGSTAKITSDADTESISLSSLLYLMDFTKPGSNLIENFKHARLVFGFVRLCFHGYEHRNETTVVASFT